MRIETQPELTTYFIDDEFSMIRLGNTEKIKIVGGVNSIYMTFAVLQKFVDAVQTIKITESMSRKIKN